MKTLSQDERDRIVSRERDRLTMILADWKEAGMMDPNKAARWTRAMKRLARLAGMSVEDLTSIIEADADAINEAVK